MSSNKAKFTIGSSARITELKERFSKPAATDSARAISGLNQEKATKHVASKAKHKRIQDALTFVRSYFPQVKRVIDANYIAHFEITKNDIRLAVPSDPQCCVHALACKRTYGLDGVMVFRTIAYFIKGDLATRFQLCETTTRELVALDRNGSVSPGYYKMVKPQSPLGRKKTKKRAPHTGIGESTRPQVLTSTPLHETENIRPRPQVRA